MPQPDDVLVMGVTGLLSAQFAPYFAKDFKLRIDSKSGLVSWRLVLWRTSEYALSPPAWVGRVEMDADEKTEEWDGDEVEIKRLDAWCRRLPWIMPTPEDVFETTRSVMIGFLAAQQPEMKKLQGQKKK